MKLECPSCQAKYEVADSAIGDKGRNMRCAACGHYWFQKPANSNNDDIATENLKTEKPKKNASIAKKEFLKKSKTPNNASPHEKLRQKAHEKIKLTYIGAIAFGWLLAFSILLGILFLGILNRNEIVKKWPKSASAFALLGANVNLYGLEISKVAVRSGVDGEGQRIIISGIINNISNTPKAVPYLRVNLYGDKKQKIATMLIDPHITILDKKQFVKFEGIKRNPPSGIVSANIVFEGAPREIPKTEMALKPTHDNTNNLLLAPAKADGHANEAENHAINTADDKENHANQVHENANIDTHAEQAAEHH